MMLDDVIKWKHFSRCWPLMRRIHRIPPPPPPRVSGGFPLQRKWRGALMFSLMCAWSNGWANSRDDGDLRRHDSHCDVIVMCQQQQVSNSWLDRHFTLFQLVLCYEERCPLNFVVSKKTPHPVRTHHAKGSCSCSWIDCCSCNLRQPCTSLINHSQWYSYSKHAMCSNRDEKPTYG